MTKRFVLKVLILLVVGIGTQGVMAGRAYAQEINYKLASLYVYNFAKYIEWPVSAPQSDFVIGIIGNSGVLAELQTVAQQKKINGKSVVVRKISSADEAAECHIVFVSSKESNEAKLITDKGSPVLVISEKPGMAKKGSMINLFVDDNDDRTKFEINKSMLEKHKLKVSGELLKLGIIV
jgi:hypothetical protein